MIDLIDLILLLQIESGKTFIDTVDAPFFICPKKFESEAHKKKVDYLNFKEKQRKRSLKVLGSNPIIQHRTRRNSVSMV